MSWVSHPFCSVGDNRDDMVKELIAAQQFCPDGSGCDESSLIKLYFSLIPIMLSGVWFCNPSGSRAT